MTRLASKHEEVHQINFLSLGFLILTLRQLDPSPTHHHQYAKGKQQEHFQFTRTASRCSWRVGERGGGVGGSADAGAVQGVRVGGGKLRVVCEVNWCGLSGIMDEVFGRNQGK